MYAIVKTGGKQYRVERGQRLLVERLRAEEGASVALEPILFRSEDAVLDRAGLEKVKVTAKVIAHERGQKLRVFKFKPKRGYKRRNGHRQSLTRIEVTEIELTSGSRARAAGAKAEDSPKAAHAPTKAKTDTKASAPAKAKAEAKPAEATASATKAPAAPKAKAATKVKAATKAKTATKAKAKDTGQGASKPRAAKIKAEDAADKKTAKPKAEEE